MSEAGFHAVHAGLHGDFSLRFVLPVLLVTQQEETTQLLAPRRQQGCKDTHACTNVSLTSPQHTHTHTCPREYYRMFLVLCVHCHMENNWNLFSLSTSNDQIFPVSFVKTHACFQTQSDILAKVCRGQSNSINVHLQWMSHNISICKVNYPLKMLNSIKDQATFLLQTERLEWSVRGKQRQSESL